MKKLLLFSIRLYQKIFSESCFSNLFPGFSCRFVPTCSSYTYQAVARYGTIKGLILGFKRVCRCHPWSKGGHDPVK